MEENNLIQEEKRGRMNNFWKVFIIISIGVIGEIAMFIDWLINRRK